MSLTAQDVYRWFREIIEKKRRRVERDDVIHVSEASNCLRRAWFERRRPQPALDPSNIVLTIGSSVHNVLQSHLARKGWLKEVETRVAYKDFIIVGSADLYHPEEHVVVELKTSNNPPSQPYHSHVLQTNAYVHFLNAKHGYIVYIGKAGSVKVHQVKRSRRGLRELFDRAETLYKALTTNTPAPPEHGPWCEYCPYKWFCMKKK